MAIERLRQATLLDWYRFKSCIAEVRHRCPGRIGIEGRMKVVDVMYGAYDARCDVCSASPAWNSGSKPWDCKDDAYWDDFFILEQYEIIYGLKDFVDGKLCYSAVVPLGERLIKDPEESV